MKLLPTITILYAVTTLNHGYLHEEAPHNRCFLHGVATLITILPGVLNQGFLLEVATHNHCVIIIYVCIDSLLAIIVSCLKFPSAFIRVFHHVLHEGISYESSGGPFSCEIPSEISSEISHEFHLKIRVNFHLKFHMKMALQSFRSFLQS